MKKNDDTLITCSDILQFFPDILPVRKNNGEQFIELWSVIMLVKMTELM